MAKVGEENKLEYGFSVLPVTAIFENEKTWGKVGDHQFHIFSSIIHLVWSQNFALALFSVSPGKAVIPRRNLIKGYEILFFLGGEGGWGGGG